MLKSCSYCGDIHDNKQKCSKKHTRKYKVTHVDKFRSTSAWQKKRKQINERDRFMCQVCIRELYNTQKKYNYEDISIHHIVPLAEDFGERLNDDFLIALCSYHHKMAEDGTISREELFEIVKEQEKTGK